MNARYNLILANGRDVTVSIQACRYNSSTHKYDVTYQSGKTYSYNYNSIEWVKDPEALNPALVRATHGQRELFNIHSILVFMPGATTTGTSVFRTGASEPIRNES